ncbi:MAG: glycerate kinase type-2 family protein [bacterium]
MTLRDEAQEIGTDAVNAMLPDTAVRSALGERSPNGRVILVAIGKAAWSMAKAAWEELGSQIERGIVITKDGHSEGEIGPLVIREASHPIIDERALAATEEALSMVSGLSGEDTVLFLVSGGGSALFEKPVEGISLQDLQDITGTLMNKGADIVTLNAVRKRCSSVKGGRFALAAAPARVEALILSDVLGDRLDSIASGPAAPDAITTDEVTDMVRRYGLAEHHAVQKILTQETPKTLDNVHSRIIGSVSVLCEHTRRELTERGYNTLQLTSTVNGEAAEVGKFLAEIAREVQEHGHPAAPPCAILVGGETVVNVTGDGKGGRNQEMALAAALAIEGLDNTVVLCLASDGTDGPTDATGGIVDGKSAARIRDAGLDPRDLLARNDAYRALEASQDLLKSGPTGTNVNDIAVVLCR